jgi:hypothetical protein
MIRVKGNPSQIASLVRKLEGIATAAKRDIVGETAGVLTAQAQAAFDGGMTADGGSRPAGASGPVSLVASGSLRGALQFTPSANGASCTLPDYAKYLARFGILPAGPLPAAWAQALGAKAREVLQGAANAL